MSIMSGLLILVVALAFETWRTWPEAKIWWKKRPKWRE